MKKVAFVVSHLGSDSDELVRILNKNPRIQIHNTPINYESVANLDHLFEYGHKLNNAAAIYGDHLLHNYRFAAPSLYDTARFLYVIRPARQSLNRMGKSPLAACRYYCFRLRRICEMAKRTSQAILITWLDLADGGAFKTIEDFLELKDELKPNHTSFEEDVQTAPEFLEEAQDSYERHLYYLRHLKHLIRK